MLTIKPHGMVVKMGRQIRGLVPTMHLADILMKNPEKKYHVGDEVKCRVSLPKGCWWGWPDRKRAVLHRWSFCLFPQSDHIMSAVLCLALGREKWVPAFDNCMV